MASLPPSTPYRKLPYEGRIRSQWFVSGKSSLWMGDDHVIDIQQRGFIVQFTENSRRFYFKDLRGISIQPNETQTRLSIGWALVFAFFGWFAVSVSLHPHQLRDGHEVVVVFDAAVALWAAGVWIANHLRGPTCLCRFHTSVQNEIIWALSRKRAAEKFIAEFNTIIEQHQGPIPTSTSQLPPRVSLLPSRPTSRPRKSSPSESGIFHLLFFGLMIADALMMTIEIYHYLPWVAQISNCNTYAIMALGIVSLVRQTGKNMPIGLQAIGWCSLAYEFISYCTFWTYQSIMNVAHHQTHSMVVKKLSANHLLQTPFYHWYTIVNLSLCLPLGLAGLCWTLDYRRKNQASTHKPA